MGYWPFNIARLPAKKDKDSRIKLNKIMDVPEACGAETWQDGESKIQIFNEDYTARNKVHCYYIMGLGNWGLGNEEKANLHFTSTS